MPHDFLLSRRSFLIGCSVAASPLLTPVTFAAAKGDNRLVVVVLRGAFRWPRPEPTASAWPPPMRS